MSAGEITAIVVAGIGLLGSAGLWSWMSSRHRPPIDRAAAEQAEENARIANALATSKEARELAGAQAQATALLREEVAALRQRVEAAEHRARSAEREHDAAERYIRALLAHIAAGHPPPAPPRTTQ